MKTITYQKAGIDFTLTFHSGRAIAVEANCLFETGDWEYNEKDKKVDKLLSGYNEGVITVCYGGYILANGKKVSGIRIDDKSVREQIEKWISDFKKEWDDDVKDREANRISPTLNEQLFKTFHYGCDTGLLYPEEDREIIQLALKNNGGKQIPVYRGQRDSTNKFQGQMDSHIPAEYVKTTKKGATAIGYDHVNIDLFCIPVADFEAAKAIIDADREAKKVAAEKVLQDAFEEAKTTGKPVLISKVVVPEEQSPLARDGEGDMVDVCKYAMPDGTIKNEYYHNY